MGLGAIAGWAESQIGKTMRNQITGQGKAATWKLGRKGRGVWFILESGARVYKPVPKRLQRGD